MDVKSVFAQNLNYYMSQNGKTRRDLSDALGVSYYTVTDWVQGKKYPRMDKVDEIAKYFGVKRGNLVDDRRVENAEDDGLSESQRALIQFAETVPADKAALALRVMQSIVGDNT